MIKKLGESTDKYSLPPKEKWKKVVSLNGLNKIKWQFKATYEVRLKITIFHCSQIHVSGVNVLIVEIRRSGLPGVFFFNFLEETR